MTPSYFSVSGSIGPGDRRAALRCRVGHAGAACRVPAGLYSLGRPDADAPVLLTGSARLTFDGVRRDCAGRDLWIVVADTGALDVVSAVAAGRLGTAEIAQAVQKSRVAELVTRKVIIVPGCTDEARPDAIRAATGFSVVRGPRRSGDIPSFLDAGGRLGPEMELTRFPARDRLALTPSEVARSLMLYPVFAFAALIYAGLGPEGVNVARALVSGWQLLLLGFASIVCGSFLAPLVPPGSARPPYLLRGGLIGLAATAALVFATPLSAGWGPWLRAAALLFFTGAAAGLAARFATALP